MSIGNTKDQSNKGVNFPWQLAMLQTASKTPIQILQTNFNSLSVNNKLTPGQWYYLTDKGLYLLALTNSKVADQGFLYDSVINEIHTVFYNLSLDYIYRRIDHRGNDITITYQYSGGTNYMNYFIWGSDDVTGNTIVDSMVILTSGTTFIGSFKNNHITGDSYIDLSNSNINANSILSNTFSGGYLVCTQAIVNGGVNMSNCTINHSTIYIENDFSVSMADMTATANSVLTLGTFSQTSLTINIYNTKVDNSSYMSIYGAALGTANINNAILTNNSTLYYFDDTLAAYGTVNKATVENSSSLGVNDCRGASDITVSEESTLILYNLSTYSGLNGFSVSGKSSLSISNMDGASSQFYNINVSQLSTVLFSGDDGNCNINNWNVYGKSYVQANDVKNAGTVNIRGWTVTLYISPGSSGNGFASHNNLILDLALVGNNQVLRTSNLIVYYDFSTKITGTKIVATAATADAYAGHWFIYGSISTNPLAPSVIDGFTNASVIPSFFRLTIENGYLPALPTISYLQITKTARQNNSPVGIEGCFLMPADLVLEGTGDTGGNGGDTITFYKQFQGELMQVSNLSYR